MRLPIRELPDVDAATVSVTTVYTGAAPEIVDTDITEVIEGAVAGVAGVKTISSQSRRGRGRTAIEFEPHRNIDEAANDVRDAVARVRGDLPDDVEEPQVTKSDDDDDPVLRIAITSDRLTPAEITDYVERFVIDRLSTLDGVSQVEIYGQRRFAIRIWLDRRALAARNMTIDEIESALRRNNVELPAGELKSTSRQFTVRAQSRLSRGRAVREHRDRPDRRLSDPARRRRARRARRRGRGHHRAQRRARGGRPRRTAPVAGQYDRDLEPGARAARPDPPDPARRHGDQHQLRRRGVHQKVHRGGGASRSASPWCWSCW